MAVWLIRAGKHGEDEAYALDKGYAIIGWLELPDISRVSSHEEMKRKHEEFIPRDIMFSTVACSVYGKAEEISISAINLLWEPTGCLVRFVLAVTSRGPIVLMCSDLNQDPVLAIQLY